MENLKRIYLDHSATTPVRPDVLDAMLPFLSQNFGNPSSLHEEGRNARESLEEARATAAKVFECLPEEIVFTSGGTEADNLAIIGGALSRKKEGAHVITSAIEHPAVLQACVFLEKQGFQVTRLPVYKEGVVRVEDVENAITKNTVLITVMHANNEIGTIQPISEIGKLAGEKGILFHTDAVQSVGKIPVSVKDLNVDLLSASGHKIYGPKGIGLLFVKKGVKLQQQFHGGHQEKGVRPGTENVAGIIGFAKALELAQLEREKESIRLQTLRDKLISGVLEKIPESWLNGERIKRLPNNANFGFKYIEGEGIILRLDMLGIAASTGSACSSRSLAPSHVLTSLGLSHEEAHGSLRLTLGKSTDDKAIDYAINSIENTVKILRQMSPLYGAKKPLKISEGFEHDEHIHGKDDGHDD